MPRSFISPRFKKILLVALLLPAVGALAFTLFLTYSVSYGRSVPPARPNTIKVACVGDSITYGGLTENERYPHLLEQLLGSAYSVRNFGAIEHTVQKAGHLPYWDHRYFRLSSEFAPDVVIIMLGTNDAHPKNWAGAARFSADYRALIEHYQSLPSRPQLFLATPPSTYVECTSGNSHSRCRHGFRNLRHRKGHRRLPIHPRDRHTRSHGRSSRALQSRRRHPSRSGRRQADRTVDV